MSRRGIHATWLVCGLGWALLAQRQTVPSPAAKPKKAEATKAAKTGAVKPVAKTTEEAAAGLVSVESSSLGLRFGPIRPLVAQPDDEVTLPGGMRIVVSENREIPIINVYVLVPAGSIHDPAGKAGLAEATASVVGSGGTATLTASALQERLSQLGAALQSGVAETRAQFSFSVPSAAFDAAGPILRDLLAAPRLDPEAVDTVLGRLRETIGLRYQNPATAMMRLFRQRLYPADSPWARMPEYDSADSITRSDIEAFHRQYYRPERTVVAIEGDIAAADHAKAVGLFAEWKTATPAGTAPAAVEPPKPGPGAMLLADRDDLRSSALILGHLGGRVSDPDYPAMLLICDLLAAGPESRLPARVRAAGGWRAEWQASWDAGFDRPGEFAVRATFDSPFATQTITIVKGELAKLREGAITDQEIERVRTALLTRLAVRYEASADQARERAAARFHRLPPELMARTLQSLATLTRADVARAAARNLFPEQVVLVAGNAALFDKPLSSIAPKVEPVELTVKAALTAKTRSDPASFERGRLLLGKMREALGGEARLKAIRDISIRQEGLTVTGDQTMRVKLWDRWLAGNTYRQDQEIGAVNQTIFYNGKIAWIGRRGLVAPLPAAGVALVRSEIFRFPFRLALAGQDPGDQVADLGGNVLEVSIDSQSVRIYLDPGTALPQRYSFRVDLGNGVSVSVDEALSEWKEFDGVKWPTRITTKKNGRRADELTVIEAKFNSALSVADLEKKP